MDPQPSHACGDNPAPPEAQPQEKHGENGGSNANPDQEAQLPSGHADAATNANGNKKSLAFHLSFVGIALVAFLFSLDATTQAVALPVSSGSLGRAGSTPG
jgi:hypothetical protein